MEVLIVIGIVIWVIIASNSRKSSRTPAPPHTPYDGAVTATNYPQESSSKNIIVPKHALQDKASLSLPNDFELSEEFKAGFDAIEHRNENLYITGVAGTGKTTLLKYFRRNTKKSYVVLAPTGIAAINSLGQTIHSFLQFPHRLIKKEDIKHLHKKKNIFLNLDLLIVDEVSMVRADVMDAIDHALRINTERENVPFGGVQIVLFGDLFQLPPVIDKELALYYDQLYDVPYFFGGKSFTSVSFKPFHLTQIYRQKDDKFVRLLNKVRNRTISEADLGVLNERVLPDQCEALRECITLTPTNAAANALNARRLRELSGPEFEYIARIMGEFDEQSYPTETHLRLKVGAQVLMNKNDPDKRWVNGSIGIIVELGQRQIKVRIKGNVHEVSTAVWEKIRYQYNRETKRIEEEVIGSFEQYPIRLAWAITIHKSQGLTFDKLIIDLDNGAFAHGHVYVALSRCRSLEGIYLKKPVAFRDLIFDERILRLDNYFHTKPSTTTVLQPADVKTSNIAIRDVAPQASTATPSIPKEHRNYLKNSLSIPSSYAMSSEERGIVEKYGPWMRALAEGKIQPISDKEKRFIEVAKGVIPPDVFYEKAWMNYMKCVNPPKNQGDPGYNRAHGSLGGHSDYNNRW